MSATGMPATPPSQDVDPDLQLVLPGRGLSAGAGWDWIKQGWSLFARAPLMWVVAIVLVFIVAMVVGFVPIIGSLAFQLAQPVIAGGFMVACRALEKGGEFELEHLVQGFSRRFVPLLIVGAIFLLGWILLLLLFVAMAGMAWIGMLMSGDASESAVAAAFEQGGMMLIWLLVIAALAVPLTAAYWFAPALVMMHDMKPVAAMKASFFACFRNFVPFLVYGLVMMLAIIVAVIPFGLGMLVWIPLAIASTYVGYRQIFTEA
jgi:uncharacterized membrane protein